MRPRLVLLIVVAAVLAIFVAKQASAPPAEETGLVAAPDDPKLQKVRTLQKLLRERPLPGEEPPEEPEFSIQVEVDPTGAKNRLYYYLTESHGYYVETFKIRFWYKPTPDTQPGESPIKPVPVFLNKYLKANDTLAGCMELVPAELSKLNGHLGTSDNWAAEVLSYDRAREHNPDPLPLLDQVVQCD